MLRFWPLIALITLDCTCGTPIHSEVQTRDANQSQISFDLDVHLVGWVYDRRMAHWFRPQ